MKIENRSVKYNPTHKKIHELWRSMIGRCHQPNNHSYHNYGARGVVVCERWRTSYDNFLEDVDSIEGFDLEKLLNGKLQLDKDIKGNGKIYDIENCKFVSPSENYANRRNNRYFIAIDLINEKVIKSKNREEFCRQYGLDSSSVWRILQVNSGKKLTKNYRTYKGWTFYYIEDFNIESLPNITVYHSNGLFFNTKKEALNSGFNDSEIVKIIKISKDSTTIKSEVNKNLSE